MTDPQDRRCFTPRRAPSRTDARARLLEAALAVLSSQYSTHISADSSASAEYADEMLALAARDLVEATNHLKASERPVGWDR